MWTEKTPFVERHRETAVYEFVVEQGQANDPPDELETPQMKWIHVGQGANSEQVCLCVGILE